MNYDLRHMDKNAILKPIIGFSLALDIILIDQLVKWAVMELVLRPETGQEGLSLPDWVLSVPETITFVSVEVTSFFNLVMVWNKGISFGLFQNDMPIILIVISLAITVFFSVWLTRSQYWIQTIALGMVIGGALGNVIDRLRFGAVADFFDFHIAEWHYPAFNIADSCITLGVAILVIDGLFLEPKRRRALEQ